MLLCIFLQGASGLGSAFSPGYEVFVSLRFLTGAASMGLFMTEFVLGEKLHHILYKLHHILYKLHHILYKLHHILYKLHHILSCLVTYITQHLA